VDPAADIQSLNPEITIYRRAAAAPASN